MSGYKPLRMSCGKYFQKIPCSLMFTILILVYGTYAGNLSAPLVSYYVTLQPITITISNNFLIHCVDFLCSSYFVFDLNKLSRSSFVYCLI